MQNTQSEIMYQRPPNEKNKHESNFIQSEAENRLNVNNLILCLNDMQLNNCHLVSELVNKGRYLDASSSSRGYRTSRKVRRRSQQSRKRVSKTK